MSEMNRRSFLKTIAAGAVAAVVPLPAAAPEPFIGCFMGGTTTYFTEKDLAEMDWGEQHSIWLREVTWVKPGSPESYGKPERV